MNPAQEIELFTKFIDALNNMASGLHDIADAMRQGPEDNPDEAPETYLDGTPVKGKV